MAPDGEAEVFDIFVFYADSVNTFPTCIIYFDEFGFTGSHSSVWI